MRGFSCFRAVFFLWSLGFIESALALEDDAVKNYSFFGSMCHSYAAADPSSPDGFKCRRYRDSLFVDGLVESVMYDEIMLWGGSDYSFPGQEPLRKLYLNSKGGLMFDHSGISNTAVDIMDLIQEKGLETHAGLECKSACVPVFAAGLKRTALKESQFMVHNPRMSTSRVLFLREKCGMNMEKSDCAAELAEIKYSQQVDMELYFDLIEEQGVSYLLRQRYLRGNLDPLAPGNGNLLGLEDYYFDGEKALAYGLALELRDE